MTSSFERLVKEVREEAEAEGPHATTQLEAFEAHFALANQLLTLRREKKLSQTKLAKLSGVPQSEISRIERGYGNPTTSTLNALAKPLEAKLTLSPV